MSLDAACQAVERDDLEGALALLLAVWRETRAPAVADVIDGLALGVNARCPPIAAVGSKSSRQAWLAAAATKAPAVLGRLLEALPDTTGPFMVERLEALAGWPADPRLATAVRRWLADPPFAGRNRARCFPPALRLLEAHQDARVIPAVQQLAEPAARSATIAALGLRTWKPLVALVARMAKWPRPPQPPPDDVARLVQLVNRLNLAPAPHRMPDRLALFDAVYAAPDDDTPRLVLADLLQQRGDPRGEFITLQLRRHAAGGAARATPRERLLAETWGREWLGALEPAFLKTGVEFARGFVVAGRYEGACTPAGIADRPEWSTVEHLDVHDAAQYVTGAAPVLLSPHARSLRHVHGAGIEDLRRIAAVGRTLPWRSLGLTLWRWSEARDLLAACTTLPCLERLDVDGREHQAQLAITGDDLARVCDGPAGAALAHIAIAAPSAALGPLLAHPVSLRLASLALRVHRVCTLRFTAATKRLVVELAALHPYALREAEGALATVPPGVVDDTRLVLPARAERDGAMLVLRGGRTVTLGPLLARLPID